MSYFYLTPIDGISSLHVLEECVLQRLSHLEKLCSGKTTNFSEFLLEGSTLDIVGHFLLGLLARLSGSIPLKEFVDHGELTLFTKRINFASPSDIRLLCKSILKNINTLNRDERASHINYITLLSRKLIIKHVAEHVFNISHTNECKDYSIDVNYLFCLPLISKRMVEIDHGSARIPCGLWKYFFRILFKTHSDYKYKDFRKKSTMAIDPRWREIMGKLIQKLPSNRKSNQASNNYIDVDRDLYLFPLCMQNLHVILRNKHRLTHNERFRYSLFLKDIGLPVQQAINFWRHEYSKPGKSTCSHVWMKDEKKFVYGIRHLYGLEGGRKNYCMSNCKSIQMRPSAEGGCAFKHYDGDYLDKIADSRIKESKEWSRLISKMNMGLSNEACSIYKQAIVSQIISKSDFVAVANEYSPVNYYLGLKSYIESIPKVV